MVGFNLQANDLVAGRAYSAIYDGTYFLLNYRRERSRYDVANILDWDGADPTGSNDNSSYFTAALAQSYFIEFPVGNFALANSSAFEIKDYHSIFGAGAIQSAAAAGASGYGASRLLMTGTASTAFVNADTGTSLNHCSFENLSLYSTGSYTRLFDFTEMIGCDFSGLDVESNQTTTALFRSQKIASTNQSWVNNFFNTRWRIPDAATAYNFDVDISDSPLIGNVFGGGYGCIVRGTGGVRIVGNIINNTNSSGAGLTVSIETESGAQHVIVGNQIEENDQYDILIDGDADDTLSNTFIGLQINANMFRSSGATHAIYAKNATGNVLSGLNVTANSFKAITLVNTVNVDRSRWEVVTVEDNNYRLKNFDRENLGFENNTNFTISAGAISMEGRLLFIGTEGGAATDDLDTINNGSDGDVIHLHTIIDATRVVTVKDGTGNIQLAGGADCVLTNRRDTLVLAYNSADSEWWEVSRSIN